MFKRIRIANHQRGLVFKHGNFERVLKGGRHWLPLRRKVEVYSILDTEFAHPLMDVLAKESAVLDELRFVDLRDDQRALIWVNDRLAFILGPGRHAFWREPHEVTVEIFDTEKVELEHPRMDAVLSHWQSKAHVATLQVDAHEGVVLFRDGEPARLLNHGRFVYWRNTGRLQHKTYDVREQLADVSGQEIMTRDKVTLRVNLLVTYAIVDPLKSASVVHEPAQALYREAQLLLRAAVGTRLLDELLTDKESVGQELLQAVSKRVAGFGVAVRSIGLRDIILPGEMKLILNQVIEAEKQAQANLIRRREETAAARSQANTAKLLAESPTLARMRELELLGDILARTKSMFVFGQGDLRQQVASLIAGHAAGKQ